MHVVARLVVRSYELEGKLAVEFLILVPGIGRWPLDRWQ